MTCLICDGYSIASGLQVRQVGWGTILESLLPIIPRGSFADNPFHSAAAALDDGIVREHRKHGFKVA